MSATNHLFIDEGLKAIRSAALNLRESYRLIDVDKVTRHTEVLSDPQRRFFQHLGCQNTEGKEQTIIAIMLNIHKRSQSVVSPGIIVLRLGIETKMYAIDDQRRSHGF